MVFSSAVFLFVFLPVTFVLSRVIPNRKGQNGALMALSLIFYAFGNILYLPLLLVSALINYTGGRLVMQPGNHRKGALAVTVILNLTILGVFKYADFAVETVNSLLGLAIPLPGIELPIGISFFTFQGMSYVIDVYREPQSGSRSFAKVLLYISFFPQLVAGPIVKYKDVAEQIDSRVCTPEMTSDGIVRFVRGLSKKLLLADTVGAAADSIFALTAAELDFRLAWLGAVCYFFQIFYDFSGYSDMAIGLGKMFGFTFLENFTHPYSATSIKEFWRRWHISLSSWFRDYLYIPLGGNRKGTARTYLNKLIVFFCTGLWHGASWTFVLWGLWHGACSLLEDFFRNHHIEFPKPVGRIWTILMAMMAFVLFRADTVAQAGVMFAQMFTGFAVTTSTSATLARLLSPTLSAALIVCAVFSFPVADRVRLWIETKGGMSGAGRPGREEGNAVLREGSGEAGITGGFWYLAAGSIPALLQAASLCLLVLDILTLAGASFSPFIYFQF